jgi:integrase
MKHRQHVKIYPHRRSDNGKESYEVRWSEGRGLPRRKVHGTLKDAEEHADHVEKLCQQGMRIVGNLSIQELAGVALMLAQIPNVPPHEVIQYYLQAHGLNGHSANSVPLESAAAQYIALRDNPDEFSHRQFTSVRQHLNRLARHFPGRMLNTIRVEELNDYVQDEIGGAPKTRANHVIDIRAFGRWCRSEKKWLPRLVPTAFEETRMPRVKASNKEIYTPEEMTRLLVFTPTHTLGFMTTGAFGGMRAAERLRLTGEHWQSDNEQIAADRDITKTARRRIIGSLPNLTAWMRIIETEKDEYIVRRRKPYEQVAKICKAAGVKWKFNALRTSFASYHLQKFRNGALTAALDGHSEDQLETDYKSLTGVNDRTAEEWFAITPESVVAYAAEQELPQPEWSNKI